jgi:hypothetical protein
MTNGANTLAEAIDVPTTHIMIDEVTYGPPKVEPEFIDKTIDVQEADRLRIEAAQKSTEGAKYSGEQITNALAELFDRLYEVASLKAILLGEVAKACRENRPMPPVDLIEFAIPISSLTYEVKSNFKTWGFRETKFGYEYDYSVPLQWHILVPIRIYVYREKFKLFDVPDRVWAGVDGAFIPNPFDSYWKIRHLVKRKLEKGLKLSSEKI